MGLDTTHGAWHGAYSAFHRWRKALAEAAGGELTMDGGWDSPIGRYTYQTESFDTPEQEEGFREIMSHSDCDGEISPEMCAKVADALEHLLPRLTDSFGDGHIARGGGYEEVTRGFIRGLRRAHEANEPLEFH